MKEEQKQRGFHVLEWIVAGLVGVGTGVLGAVVTTYELFHKKVLNYPGFKQLYEDHGRKLSDRTEKAKKDFAAASNLDKRVEITKQWIKDQRQQKINFTSSLNDGLKKELGVEGHTLKGFMQRWGTLGPHRQFNVRSAAAISTVVGAAATLMFFNSVHMRNDLNKLNDKLDKLTDDKSASRG